MSKYIDESDFGVQIFKDVATVRDLSPEGTPVNLDKFHYTVTERIDRGYNNSKRVNVQRLVLAMMHS